MSLFPRIVIKYEKHETLITFPWYNMYQLKKLENRQGQGVGTEAITITFAIVLVQAEEGQNTFQVH